MSAAIKDVRDIGSSRWFTRADPDLLWGVTRFAPHFTLNNNNNNANGPQFNGSEVTVGYGVGKSGGTVSFFYKVDSEASKDTLRFLVDGKEQKVNDFPVSGPHARYWTFVPEDSSLRTDPFFIILVVSGVVSRQRDLT